jgi:hypothetical protein
MVYESLLGVGFLPDTVRFLLVIGVIGGLIYGGALALASFPPEQTEIIKPLPHEKLRSQ